MTGRRETGRKRWDVGRQDERRREGKKWEYEDKWIEGKGSGETVAKESGGGGDS